jgi:hypothetical protein
MPERKERLCEGYETTFKHLATYRHFANTDRQSGNTYVSPYLNFQTVLQAKYKCYAQYSRLHEVVQHIGWSQHLSFIVNSNYLWAPLPGVWHL